VSGISFEEFGSVDQHFARGMARDSEITPMRLRVMFAALGWSNLIGHAEFDPAGLCQVLMKQDPRTGELSIPSGNHVTNVIKEARDMGLIGKGSSMRCLVAPAWWQKAGGKGGKTCNHHKINTQRHRRGVTKAAISHLSGVNPTPLGCDDSPLNRQNVIGLYDSDLPACTNDRGYDQPHLLAPSPSCLPPSVDGRGGSERARAGSQ
jgi:hypothetical protein